MIFFILILLVFIITISLLLFYYFSIKEKYNNYRESAFTKIYKEKLWGKEHPNGFGSLDIYTINDRNALSIILNKYDIKTMIDVPCGTMSWIYPVIKDKNIQYTGMDIVKEQIDNNRKNYPQYTFIHSDMTLHKMDRYDLVFSKEGTQHMTEKSTIMFLNNVKKSNSKYICLTHYEIPENNDDKIDIIKGISDLESGAYREQNFLLPPYNKFFEKMEEKFYIRNNFTTHSAQFLILFKINNG